MHARLLSLVALLLLLAGVGAFAQEHPPAKDIVLGKKVFIAFGKQVREEIKLTDAQVQKMQDVFEGALQVEGDRIMVTMSPDTDLADMEKRAFAVLEEKQRKRLNEVWIQMIGAIAAADESVAKELELKSEQTKSVDGILQETARELQNLFMEGHNEEVPKRMRAIRAKASEKVLALFSDDQKKTFEKMKGKPFKFEPDKSGG